MEINVIDERKKPVTVKDLDCGDTFVVEKDGILSDVFMVTDEYDEEDSRIVLCMNLANGAIYQTFYEYTEVIPVESKLEVTIR